MTDASDDRPDPKQDPTPDLLTPGGKVDPDAVRRFFDDAGDDERPRVRFELQRDHQTRLDKYLTSRVTFMSRSQLQRVIEDGHASVNDRPAKASTKLRVGDVVEVTLPPPLTGTITPEDIPLTVLY